ncbi:MAG: hypothetical protein ACREDH_07005, partial [Methylocella sp.]
HPAVDRGYLSLSDRGIIMSYKASMACTGAFAAAATLAGINPIAPAFAHELRILPADHGKISLLVGFHVEPAFEDSFNAVDTILSTFDGACPAPNASVSIGQPIDVDGTMAARDPDTVNLKVDALYLKKAVRPTGPFGSIAPIGIEAKLTITDQSPLKEAFGNPGTYDSYFRPTHPGNATTGGAYGFHVYGKVHAGPNSFSCRGTKSRTRSPREPQPSIPISSAVSRAAWLRRTTSAA